MKNKLKPIHKNAEAISIFIDVNIEDLQNRMIKQQRSDTEIKKRMDRLHMDLQVKYKCDYIIENKTTLENAVSQLHAIITQTNKVHC
ncbi:hypothetical protein GCM10011409_29950 [Lentibacillus populi]|uniref:Guanylate kinase-like domain-containing protein n=1 Tax=Lentibacillus populi TaxID=1827502 RepID=A0A9W5TZA5_9BACI|nr:hypothetical protein GCM10011409_29950 [Lentibacillus populi]